MPAGNTVIGAAVVVVAATVAAVVAGGAVDETAGAEVEAVVATLTRAVVVAEVPPLFEQPTRQMTATSPPAARLNMDGRYTRHRGLSGQPRSSIDAYRRAGSMLARRSMAGANV
ncbi:MAG: hypothetical protein ACXVLX_09175, partial [Ilumatobacteraceae bacterium]